MKELSQELKELCEKQELMRLAYTDSRGYARAVPVWYVIMDGDYYMGTYRNSEKWKSITQNPRVGWVIDAGQNPKYKGVSLHGSAEEATGEQVASVYNELGKKYFGTTHDPTFKQIYGEVDNAETGYLRLKPEGVFSWEY